MTAAYSFFAEIGDTKVAQSAFQPYILSWPANAKKNSPSLNLQNLLHRDNI